MFTSFRHIQARLSFYLPNPSQHLCLRRKERLLPRFITLIGVFWLMSTPLQLPAAEVMMFLPGGGTFEKQVTSYKERRMQQVVPQTSDYSCGAASMATLLRYHFGQKLTEKDAILGMFEHGDKESIRKRGFSMLDMKRLAQSRGLKVEGYKITDADTLKKLNIPVVTLIQTARYKHFVVLRGVDDRYVYLSDPSWGNRKVPLESFLKEWDHVILVVTGPCQGTPEGLYRETVQADASSKGWVIRNDSTWGSRIAMDPSFSMYDRIQLPGPSLSAIVTSITP
jgi:predicted double-glycine peptidase